MKAECRSARWNEGCPPPPALLRPFVPLQQHGKATGAAHLQRVMRHDHHRVSGTQTVETPVGQPAPCPACLTRHSLEFENLEEQQLANDGVSISNTRQLISQQKWTSKEMKAKRKETPSEKRRGCWVWRRAGARISASTSLSSWESTAFPPLQPSPEPRR